MQDLLETILKFFFEEPFSLAITVPDFLFHTPYGILALFSGIVYGYISALLFHWKRTMQSALVISISVGLAAEVLFERLLLIPFPGLPISLFMMGGVVIGVGSSAAMTALSRRRSVSNS